MESPCIKICVFDPVSERCSGCGRTLDEIADWSSFSDAERRRIMAELPERMKGLKQIRPD
jgi:predicted Fe-S protein YdhL (DUF1289 family)